MPKSTEKRMQNKKIRTVKNRVVSPPSKKRGIKYLVEPMSSVGTSVSGGDVFKKYVNGKLVKQVFVSSKKVKSIVKKMADKHKKGGATPNSDKKVQIESSDKTSFFQSLKSGFGSGLGLAAAFETIKWIFGSSDDGDDGGDE
jgi:hypothetical protein